MSEKQNKHFYIDSDLLDYLKEVKRTHNLSSINQAINLVLKEHKEKSNTNYLKEVKRTHNLSSINQAINLVLKEHKEKSNTKIEVLIKKVVSEVVRELKGGK